ncbi:MAG: biotin/lipoyl-binding protein, partial [Clostridia bacterium]|nr:biotin/lipoyl-binding protein [Clostridia bacterium]
APVAIADGETVEAPMPGKIFKIVKKVGDTVAEGDVVMILEAMKMENEITTGVAGTVKQIPVAEGQAVNPGDVLFVIG